MLKWSLTFKHLRTSGVMFPLFLNFDNSFRGAAGRSLIVGAGDNYWGPNFNDVSTISKLIFVNKKDNCYTEYITGI